MTQWVQTFHSKFIIVKCSYIQPDFFLFVFIFWFVHACMIWSYPLYVEHKNPLAWLSLRRRAGEFPQLSEHDPTVTIIGNRRKMYPNKRTSRILGQKVIRHITRKSSFSCHLDKNGNSCQMNACFPPSPYPLLFKN